MAFSGKLLESRENILANYDIAGGWMCKSPLYQEKLAAFDIDVASEALAEERRALLCRVRRRVCAGLAGLKFLCGKRRVGVS